MGRAATFLVEDQLTGAVPEPIDSGAAKIFQLCGMQAEQPATGAQMATTCSHRRFPANRVDCGEVEIFPALRNGGGMTGDGITAAKSLRHKGSPAHWAGNDGLAGFSGLRKDDWPRGDAEMCPGLAQRANVGGRRMTPYPAQGADRVGRAKKEQGQRPCSGGSGGDKRLLSSCADGPLRPDQPDRYRRAAECRVRGWGHHLLMLKNEKFQDKDYRYLWSRFLLTIYHLKGQGT